MLRSIAVGDGPAALALDAGTDHVFVVMVESFNANFVLTKTSEGKPYTPSFNSLTTQGLFLDNFWGNGDDPNGVGLQNNYAQMMQHLSNYFRGDPAGDETYNGFA